LIAQRIASITNAIDKTNYKPKIHVLLIKILDIIYESSVRLNETNI
jgi:hypothetical protein